MKRKLGTISVALAAAALLLPSAPTPIAHAQGGGADFTRFVAVGDSLSAGFQDGSLFDGRSKADGAVNSGQQNGFIALLNTAMGKDIDTAIPFIQYPGLAATALLVRNPNSPCAFGPTAFIPVVPPTQPPPGRLNPAVPVTNVAVPGDSIGTASTEKWVFPPATPRDYLVFLILGLPYSQAGGTPKSQIETAVGLAPTFVSFWLGGNDAIGAATGGDAGLLTPTATFNQNADTAFNALAATGAKGVIGNVPDVTVIAHLFSQADIIALVAAATGTTFEPAQMELLTGVGKKDFVVLPAMAKLTKIITQAPDAVPFTESDILRGNEVKKIRKAIKKYNKKLAALARANDWPLVDVNGILNDYDRTGLDVGSVHLTTNYLGGIFSLDGVHPTNTGHALLATAFIQAINAKYGSTLALPNIAAILAADPDVCVDGTKRGLTLDDIAAMAVAGEGARAVFTAHLPHR